MMVKVRIVSFNVLSSHLATTSHYPKLNPDHLDASNRLRVVLDKLQIEVDNAAAFTTAVSTSPTAVVVDPVPTTTTTSSTQQQQQQQKHQPLTTIFALQEVSYDWAGEFHTFFANNGYNFVTGLYGAKYNGYMGIGLAYPSSTFHCIETKIARLSDTRVDGWPTLPIPNNNDDDDTSSTTGSVVGQLVSQTYIRWKNIVTWGVRFVSTKLLQLTNNNNKVEQPICPWEKAQNRFNVILGAKLQHKTSGVTFCIGNYHMPCLFYIPTTMTLHAEMAIRFIQDMAISSDTDTDTTTTEVVTKLASNRRLPYIIAGDFNLKPGDGVYKYLTTGILEQSDPFYPSVQSRVDPSYTWKPSIRENVKSSYAVHSNEPDFTNYALVRDDDEPFIDTLDYIFISPTNIAVTDVLELPNRIDANGPYPNLDVQQPSDHVMIAANLEITN